MNKTRPDVIRILEIEKRYHADQIKRINVAIAALKGDVDVEEATRQEKSPQKAPKQTQWTTEIKDIFENNDVLFTPRKRLGINLQKGIVEAMSVKGRTLFIQHSVH